MVDFILLVIMCVVFFGGMPLIGRFVFAPVNRSHQRVQLPRRFVLTDFIWLLVLLQIGFALVVAFVPKDFGGFVVVLLLVCGSLIAIWAGAMSTLSKAGVAQSRRRALFTLFVVPGCLIVMFGVLAAIGFSLILALSTDVNRPPTGVSIFGIVGWLSACCVLLGVLRVTTNWIFRQRLILNQFDPRSASDEAMHS